jgi:uncharacterized protein (TIGR02452 family)
MNSKLALSPREVVMIQERGWYALSDGTKVSIKALQDAARNGTRLYLPEDFDQLWSVLSPVNGISRVTVESATTLEAARRLRGEHNHVTLLNFASAKNPGGGFLGNARAQEESLARASGLYTCLLTQPEYYEFHREQGSLLYSDRVIYAPEVPVFCDEKQRPLQTPWTVSMLTCPAVNVGALKRNEPERLPEVEGVMARRTRMVLAVAAAHRIDALVLGAWGCGVFMCDPEMIARLFAEALAEPALAGRFARVTFAIVNAHSGPDKNFAAFERAFGKPGQAASPHKN